MIVISLQSIARLQANQAVGTVTGIIQTAPLFGDIKGRGKEKL